MFRRPIIRFDSLRCPSLVDTLHALAFRSRRRRVPRRRAGGFCFSRRFPPCGFVSKGNDRASHVPGEPAVPMPCSATPAGRNASGLYDAPARPPFRPRRRLHTRMSFGAQSHGLGTRCLRFAAWVAPSRRKTRFRLQAKFYRTGFHPQGSIERFQLHHRVLLSQALWRKVRDEIGGSLIRDH